MSASEAYLKTLPSLPALLTPCPMSSCWRDTNVGFS